MNQETCKDCGYMRSTLAPCKCGKYASILPASESETPAAVAGAAQCSAACASCEHFLPIRDNEFQGKCRRYPPTFFVNAMFIWPTVAVGARCGEYKPQNDAGERIAADKSKI